MLGGKIMNDLSVISNNSNINTYSTNYDLVNLTDTTETRIALNVKEQDKVLRAFHNKDYDMSSEYIWNRSMNILRDRVSVYGNDFIADMLGYDNFASVKDISDESIINLCADIGFITQTARLKLKNYSSLLYHMQSREAVEIDNEELTKADALGIITSCINYILGASTESTFIPYTNMRNELQSKLITEDSPLLSSLINSPYFYIRTITHTIINLSSDEKNATLDITLQNLIVVLKKLWSELDETERWNIGITYSQAVSAGNTELTKALRTVLNSCKGFDYVPETTKSETYRKTARYLLAKHNDFYNFYTEGEIANLLANMGTSIPKAAIIDCLTAVLICKLGNSYGIANNAQKYLDEILDSISNDSWVYFLNQLPKNSDLLYELIYIKRNGEVFDIWKNIISKYNLQNLILEQLTVSDFIFYSYNNDKQKALDIAQMFYDTLYTKSNKILAN